jgi:hypothetical protein
VSDKDSASTKRRKGFASLDLEEHSIYREKVVGNLLEKLKPWLFEFGGWIFGGLIALNVWIMATLLNVGPVDPAILVSIAIFACALPMNVAGLFSLKLIKDMNEVAIDEMMRQAIEDAHIPDSVTTIPGLKEPAVPAAMPTQERREGSLRFSVWLVFLSAGLTVLGMAAALWHMAWWVAVLFSVMVVISAFVAINVVGSVMRPEARSRRQ